MNTSSFTVTPDLFPSNPQINLWRFEVIYSFRSGTSASLLNFVINSPPENGTCSIEPSNGTTSTQFTVSCPHWTDDDPIKDYSLLFWATKPAERRLIAFSSTPTFQVYFSAGVELQLLISIRDCVAEWTNFSSVSVRSDFSLDECMTNPLVELLSGGNQNLVGQVIGSLSEDLHQLNHENTRDAIESRLIFFLFSLGDSHRYF